MKTILGNMLSSDFRDLYRKNDGPDGWMAAISADAVNGRHLFDKQVDSNAIWFPENIFGFRDYVLNNISMDDDLDGDLVSISVAGHFDDDILEPMNYYVLRKIRAYNRDSVYFEFWNVKKELCLEFSLKLGTVVVKHLYSNKYINANMAMGKADHTRIKGILEQFHDAFKAHLLGEDVSHMVRKVIA